MGAGIIAKWYKSFRVVSVGVLEPPVGWTINIQRG
jgi:hypothetical protein